MIRVDFDEQKIFVNLLFYGPPGCGKKSWLTTMHRHAANASKLLETSKENYSSLSFQFDSWAGEKIEGFSHIFEFQTCTQNLETESDKIPEILSDADGVVFIADSSLGSEMANLRYLNALKDQLSSVGVELTNRKIECEPIEKNQKSGQQILKVSKIPCSIAFNKRDMDNCIPLDEMERALKFNDISCTETMGLEGFGAFGIFKDMDNRLIDGIHRRKSLVEIINEKQGRASP